MRAAVDTRSFAAEQTQRRLGRLAFGINRTLKSRDAGAVHDLRVAIRRFVQALRAFEPCFGGKEVHKMRRQLKRIMIPAGDVRNYDVALAMLSKLHVDAPQLITTLRRCRKEFETLLVSLLKRWMDRKTSAKWRAVLATPAARAGELGSKAIEETAQRMLPRMAKDFLTLGSEACQAQASPAQMHQFRIAAKKFRYTVELFTPLYGAALGERLAAIRRAQTLLGDVNDCAIVRGIVSRYDGGKNLASRIKKRQRKKIAEFHRHWRDAFGDREEMRHWIDYLAVGAGRPRELKKPAAQQAAASRTGGRRGGAVA